MHGLEAKSHLSAITDEEANKIENYIKGVSKTKSMDNKKSKNNEEPVIIRRAIINNDDEERREEERKKKEQSRKKDVGFIENKRNKDYNIVYRDKPTKPLTVSELLGLGKKKKEEKVPEKKEEVVTKNDKKVKAEEEPSISDAENKKSIDNKVTNKVNTKNSPNKQFNSKKSDSKPNFNKKDNYSNNSRNNNYSQRRSLDEKGIDKKIKNIMEVDIPVEKENTRDFSNKAKQIQKDDANVLLIDDFIKDGLSYDVKDIKDNNPSIYDIFTITYSSGSSRPGRPKAIPHNNLSFLTMMRFHDEDMMGLPKSAKLNDIIGLAHIPPISDTNVKSVISDTLSRSKRDF